MGSAGRILETTTVMAEGAYVVLFEGGGAPVLHNGLISSNIATHKPDKRFEALYRYQGLDWDALLHVVVSPLLDRGVYETTGGPQSLQEGAPVTVLQDFSPVYETADILFDAVLRGRNPLVTAHCLEQYMCSAAWRLIVAGAPISGEQLLSMAHTA